MLTNTQAGAVSHSEIAEAAIGTCFRNGPRGAACLCQIILGRCKSGLRRCCQVVSPKVQCGLRDGVGSVRSVVL
jgi:hypothetical protein